MAEKVAKMGIKRETGYLYFLRGSDVFKTPMKRGGAGGPGQAVKVAAGSFVREQGYLYYLDGEGDVARAKRQVGGKAKK